MKKLIIVLLCCLLTGCATKKAIMDQQKGLEEYLLYIDQGEKGSGYPCYSLITLNKDCYYQQEDFKIIEGFTDIHYPLYRLSSDFTDGKVEVYVNNELQYSLQEEISQDHMHGTFLLYPYYDENTLDVIKTYDDKLEEDVIPIYVSKSFFYGTRQMEFSSDSVPPQFDGACDVEASLRILVGKEEEKKIHFKAQIIGVLSNSPGNGEMYCKYDTIEKLIQDQLGYLPYTDAYILLSKQPNLEQRIDLTTLSQKSYLIQQEWMPTYDKRVSDRLDDYNIKKK